MHISINLEKTQSYTGIEFSQHPNFQVLNFHNSTVKRKVGNTKTRIIRVSDICISNSNLKMKKDNLNYDYQFMSMFYYLNTYLMYCKNWWFIRYIMNILTCKSYQNTVKGNLIWSYLLHWYRRMVKAISPSSIMIAARATNPAHGSFIHHTYDLVGRTRILRISSSDTLWMFSLANGARIMSTLAYWRTADFTSLIRLTEDPDDFVTLLKNEQSIVICDVLSQISVVN